MGPFCAPRWVCFARPLPGGKGAVTATAHKLAVLIYRMLKHGSEYVAQALEEYEAKLKAQLTESLRRKAQALGFELTPTAEAQPS